MEHVPVMLAGLLDPPRFVQLREHLGEQSEFVRLRERLRGPVKRQHPAYFVPLPFGRGNSDHSRCGFDKRCGVSFDRESQLPREPHGTEQTNGVDLKDAVVQRTY